MYKFFTAAFLQCILLTSSFAYEADDNLKISIVEKASQFVTLRDKGGDSIIITVFNNAYGDLFEKTFAGKQINSKNIKIKYANSIDKLDDATILYISNVSSDALTTILKKIKDKNILTVSDMRGFAEKGGIMQVYIASQKPKLKINLDAANREDIKIKASLLRIAEIIKEEK
jgi:YfiR/HmsC-like